MQAATIFDFNGVLVDDEEVHLAAFRDALMPLGVDFSDKDYWERYIGFDDVGGFEAMLKDAGHLATREQVDAKNISRSGGVNSHPRGIGTGIGGLRGPS